MVRILVSIPLILLGIFLLPFAGAGLIFLIPGVILLISGTASKRKKVAKQVMTEAILEAERLKSEARSQAGK